ncbi:hypothetical protein WICPIJ_000200 [Wickerhamomyces pijperi]|uniref:J domain-containing protein n=1 Tax=Wickerhamomyces pijperi TaxID=599730 RepID=A0A9P8TS46_WICPI|nr:hypothetical protein WICPIJ_000200 [Wickerhamomyces pijperi]
MVAEQALYNRLGVSPDANENEIKKAYRKMALKYHPDKPTGDTEKFKEISEAFDILSDQDKRAIYDQYGLEAARKGGPQFDPNAGFGGGGSGGAGGHPFGGGFGGFSAADASNIFEQFARGGGMGDDSGFHFQSGGSPFGSAFGGFGGMGGGMGGGHYQEPEPEPVQINLPVTLEDLAKGVTKKMKLNRKGPDGSKEEKIIEIGIKAGWKEGTKITFKNQGDYIPSLRARQTIQFVIQEKPNQFFKRDGNNLIYTLPLSFKESLLGFSKVIDNVDGRRIPLSRSSPIQPNSEDKYPGLGFPISKSPGQKGDLIIRYKIDYPLSLTPEQKEMVSKTF